MQQFSLSVYTAVCSVSRRCSNRTGLLFTAYTARLPTSSTLSKYRNFRFYFCLLRDIWKRFSSTINFWFFFFDVTSCQVYQLHRCYSLLEMVLWKVFVSAKECSAWISVDCGKFYCLYLLVFPLRIYNIFLKSVANIALGSIVAQQGNALSITVPQWLAK